MSLLIQEEHLNTAFTLSSIIEDSQIGGHYGKSLGARAIISQHPIKKAYLILAITLSSQFNPMYRWKIVLDEVVLTREYKPIIESSIANSIHSIFVYDVTSTLRNAEPTLRIVYDGKDPIKIDSALLISLHSYENFHTYIEGYIHILSLTKELIRNYRVPTSFNANEGKVILGITTTKYDELSVLRKEDGKMLKTKLIPGFNLIELPIDLLKEQTLTYRSQSVYTKHIFHLYVASYSTYPVITIDKVSLNPQDNTLHITLSNTGNTTPDSLMLVLLRYGTVLLRHTLEPLKPGEQREVAIELKDKKTMPSLLRVVWHKATKTFVTDTRIKDFSNF